MPAETNQKIETSFQTALSATPNEREKSDSLSFGYEPEEDSWEIIIRFTGNLSELLLPYPTITYYELLGGYAILNLSTQLLEVIASIPEIIYIEKPKALYFELYEGKRASCITSLPEKASSSASLIPESTIPTLIFETVTAVPAYSRCGTRHWRRVSSLPNRLTLR